MKKKITILFIVFVMVISSIIYAKENVSIKYSVMDNGIISQMVDNTDSNNIKIINQYKINNYFTRKTNLKLEDFDLKDSSMKSVLNIKGNIKYLEIPTFTVKKGSQIETLTDGLFICADNVTKKNNKFIHAGSYHFMDSQVILREKQGSKIVDEKKITTLEEYNMIKNNSLNKSKWNDISYVKGGKLVLDEIGDYVISIKDNKLDTKEVVFLSVVENAPKEPEKNNNLSFKDVKKDSWYYKDVMEAVQKGVIIGRDDGTFDPNGKLTVAEALTLSAKIRSNFEKEKFVEGGNRWYDNAVSYNLDKNIINIGDFIDYNKKASREEMAYIFSRTLPIDEYKLNDTIKDPIDVDSNSKYYESISRLYKSQILKGRDDGKFDPKTSITRAETATIVNRLVK